MSRKAVILFIPVMFALAVSALAESSTTKLLDSMIESGAPIDPDSFIDYTSETDPNGLLGQDGNYISKTDFTINGITGTVEGFDAVVDAYSRFGYIKGVYTAYPSTIQNMYLRGFYIMRLDANTDPENLKSTVTAFETTILDADETTSYTVNPIEEDVSLREMLIAAGLDVETSDSMSDINSITWVSSSNIDVFYIEYNYKQYQVISSYRTSDMFDVFSKLCEKYNFDIALFSDNPNSSTVVASYMPAGWTENISTENFTDKSRFLEYVSVLLNIQSHDTPKDIPDRHYENFIKEKLPSYYGVELQKVTINPDYSTDNPDDHIVLVNFSWNVKNSKATTKDMLTMYADDLAASIAEEFSDVNEIAIFWEVPYLNLNAKNSYECSNGHAYIADVIY